MSDNTEHIDVNANDVYNIKLPQFEGPFDLLLFFIERDELDIYDIPIAKITDEFLRYTHQLDDLNIEVASEFILVAATLMRIKAKTLLPRKELDADGNEIDPREELVQRLIEYKQFKDPILKTDKTGKRFIVRKDYVSNLLKKEVKAMIDFNKKRFIHTIRDKNDFDKCN